MPQTRYDNPKAVIVEIDANGWPNVVIFTAEGTVQQLFVKPQGHAEILDVPTGEGYDGNYRAIGKRVQE